MKRTVTLIAAAILTASAAPAFAAPTLPAIVSVILSMFTKTETMILADIPVRGRPTK